MEQHVSIAGEKVRDLNLSYVAYGQIGHTVEERLVKRSGRTKTVNKISLRYCDGGVLPREKGGASCEKTDADSVTFPFRHAELSAGVSEELWDCGCEETNSGS
ncbi:hypothetical protein KIN20_019715 [Parelaphostrongylus tenuis]|uniref:Uncharacterized protein n=1 Tax=Parelaphostrongylus tenuis TaxID=148309 RepID=A0AAD5QV78_PARTN|nr:hypothetical protein KIN20_019715 [Parelaphostrongylus tenuis]